MKLHYLFALTIFFTSFQIQAGDPAIGKGLSNTCAACHGVDGNSVNPVWPKLAGQHTAYTAKQLKDFKEGKRANAQMAPMAANLSDEDMQHLGAYYASQKSTIGSADPELVELGEKVYRYGDQAAGVPACMACHGPAGEGNPAALYPALSGQHAAYTAIQLKMFKSAERNNDANSVMRSIATPMTEAQIEAVSSYIEGLH